MKETNLNTEQRETISDIVAEMRETADHRDFDSDGNMDVTHLRCFADRIEAAARPVRNCDKFKTWKEMRNAFERWCCNLSWKIKDCSECPHYSVNDYKVKHCFSRWLIGPADGADGTKKSEANDGK